MSAMSYQQEHRGGAPVTMFLLFLVLLGVGLYLLVEPTQHALQKHGAEAQLVRKACDQGPEEMWQSASWRRPNQFWQVCQTDDGRWGLRLIEKVKTGWKEKTSFIPKEGTYFDVREYVSARAKPFFGPLP